MDAASMLIVTSNEYMLDDYRKLKDRCVKIRIITEITPDNLSYSKKMISFAEVRHFDGLLGSFGVSKKDYISTDTSPIDAISQRAVHCNIKIFVQHQQYFFNTLWKKGIPLEQKI